MKSVKYIATKGLRDIEKRHRSDPHHQIMKQGYEYIRDHPDEFALVDL